MPELREQGTELRAAAEGAPIPLDRRTVTVLFADVAHSTELIEGMDAEAAANLLGSVLNAVTVAVERYGGTITKRMGDGLMSVFGVPNVQEDHAVRACHAALAAQQAVLRMPSQDPSAGDAPVKIRVGLNSGLVVVAASAGGGHIGYDTIGPMVHLASRMETVAEPGSIMISEHTYRRIRHLFDCRPLGVRTLKGFSDPQAVYQLLRPLERPLASSPADGHTIGAPLVGRERELEAIEARFRAIGGGEGSLVLITGDAGLGKTRLLQEARRALTKDVAWLEGHALSFGQRLSYWPFIEMLKPWLGIQESASETENWKSIEETLAHLMPAGHDEVLPYVATLLGFEVPAIHADRVRHLDAESLGAQIVRSLWRLFEQMAKKQSVVIVIDDLHWIDRSSAALVEHLLSLAIDAPILFCITSRPESELLDRLKAAAQNLPPGRFIELGLAPLSVQESQRFIGSLIGETPELTRLRDLVLYKAGGNPFFAEELIRALVEAKVLVHSEPHGGWTVRDREIVLPDTVNGVIMARVGRLDERLRRVLGVAAVIGRTFLYRVLRAVTEENAELDERLSKLAAMEIIEELKSEPELAYLFRHALAQEAVYESLLIEHRKNIHARVAECLELLYANRLREISSLLAFHYARAESWERALHFMLEAGEQSNRMAADDEALLHYEEAVATYTRVFGDKWEKQQRATIHLRLGEIHLRRGIPAEALRHLTAVLALYGETIPKNRFAIRMATLQEVLVQILHRALPRLMIRDLHDPVEPAQEILLRTFELLAWTTAMMDTRQLVVTVFKVLNRAERFGSAGGVTKGSAAFSHGLDVLGFSRLGGAYARRAIRVAEKTSNLSAKGIAWHLNGIHQFHVGRWDDALAWFDKGRQLAEQSGDLSTWSNASIFKCELLSETGAFEDVLALSTEMITRGRESAYEPAHRWGLTAGGKALRRLGRIHDCEPTLREAAELCLRTSDFINLGPNQAELACSLIQRGRYDEATEILEECDRAITEHRILAHTVVCVQTARALVAISTLELSGAQDRIARREANRRCKRAYRASRIFAVGSPSSMRLLGTLAWLEGRPRGAEYWWTGSLKAAERLGASYQSGLTLVERGRRRKSADDLQRGASILASLGIRGQVVERYPLL